MLYSEKHRNSTAGPLVLRGDSSSNSGPSPSTASSFPFLFWLASRGKPLEFEIQIPTAVGIQNSAILLVSASPITTAQAKACMSGASRRKFKSWFLTAICPCGFQPGSGWLFHGRREFHYTGPVKKRDLDLRKAQWRLMGNGVAAHRNRQSSQRHATYGVGILKVLGPKECRTRAQFGPVNGE